MKKVGFYINHGVEVRYFLLSGLLDEVRKTNKVCLYIHEEHSEILEKYKLEYKVEVKVLPIGVAKRARYEGFIRSFTNARKRGNDVSIYSHFGLISKSRFYDKVFKISFISLLGNKLFRFLSKWHYRDKNLIDFLKKEELSRIYFLQYDSTLLKKIGVNSSLCNIENYIFINTLKTLFIDDFVAFPVKKLFAWNEFQNRLFQSANIGIEKTCFEAKGSPYHAFLAEVDFLYNSKVVEKYNLDLRKPIILYSLINEKVFGSEHLILEKISNVLDELFEANEKPQLIIRRNPFEKNTQHLSFIAKLKNVIIADHYWERDEPRSWSIQDIPGEMEWRSFLQIASLSMNIPSMATIDSLVCCTPVITVGFNALGEYNHEVDHLINSPFNKDFNKSDFVFECNTSDSFKLNILNSINVKQKNTLEQIRNSLELEINKIDFFL